VRFFCVVLSVLHSMVVF